MGQRSSTETLIGVFTAFWEHRTWKQADLARRVEVDTRAVRRVLDELSSFGWNFERDEEPPHVYWSLRKDFFPGGVLFNIEALRPLLRVVARSPDTDERRAVLRALGDSLPAEAKTLLERLVPSRVSAEEARPLTAIESAIEARSPLRLRYYSANSGRITDRLVSVQRLHLGPPARCIAYCHSSQALKWFRVDSMVAFPIAEAETFIDVSAATIDALITSSVDGFAHGSAMPIAFFVRDPEARWVKGNLPEGLDSQDEQGGIRVETQSAGLLPIARFVVGLGEAVTIETPELKDAVRALAEGALRGLGGKTE